MTKEIPKGRTPSLIGSTLGKPRRVAVAAKSECKRCKGEITKGTNCVAIPQLGGSFTNLKRFCEDCYGKILEQTQADLDGLKSL